MYIGCCEGEEQEGGGDKFGTAAKFGRDKGREMR